MQERLQVFELQDHASTWKANTPLRMAGCTPHAYDWPNTPAHVSAGCLGGAKPVATLGPKDVRKALMILEADCRHCLNTLTPTKHSQSQC